MPPKALKYAPRYKRGDDDEGDNDEILMAQAERGEPALCMVFILPDEDEVPEDDVEMMKMDREKIISRIRMLGFNIEQMVNQGQDKIFLKITLPKEMLVRLAIDRRIKVRLDKGAPGAPVEYDPKLEKKKVLREPDDGRNVFSSLQQLEMADVLLRSEPFSDGTDDVEKLVPEQMITDTVKGVEGIPRILGYYYLHEPLLGHRGKMIKEWPLSYFKPQPLYLVQSYLGEKIALYYAWLGYYISMLWLPAVLGIMLALSQESESPYNLTFCMALVVWTTVFSCLWKRLEVRLQYEYDTQNFEETEVLRLQYTTHPSTEKGTHINEITGLAEDFWMDEGSYFPPKGRRARIAISYAFVAAFCALAILLDTCAYTLVALPMMQPGDVMAGSAVCGILFAVITLLLDLAFDSRFEHLIHEENWPTATLHEDSLILRSCAFKVVCYYFGPFLVAVVANNVVTSTLDMSCPDSYCLPVVRIIIAVQFSMLMVAHEVKEYLVPSIRTAYRNFVNSEALKKKVKKKVFTYPMEDELNFQSLEGVTSFYTVFVYQFGWVALFASVFPIMPVIALACNLVELRTDAFALLTQTKRPRYMCATDIGAWQTVMNVLATLAILTNSLLVGLTSHTLYFYLPGLTDVQRLWCVAILEHVLFLLKLLVENFLPPDTQEDREAYERQQYLAKASVDVWLKPTGGADDD